MRFLYVTDTSAFTGSECEHELLSGLPRWLQIYLRRQLTEFLADTFVWITMHSESLSSAPDVEVKRERLEMTPEWQGDKSQTGAAKQNFSGSETGIINMKRILQEL